MPVPPPRGRGRGAAPPTKREDRDLQHYANKKVATQGPPSLQTFSSRGGGGCGRGRGRGRGGPSGGWGNGGAPPMLRTDPIYIGSGNPPSSPAFPRGGASESAHRQEPWTSSSSSSSYRPRSPPRGPRADRYPPPCSSSTATGPISSVPNAPSGLTSQYQNDRYQNRSLYPSYERDNDISDRAPSSPRYSERRYSPSQPVLQDTSNPIHPSRDIQSQPTYSSTIPALQTSTSISHAHAHANSRTSDKTEVDAQHIVFGSTPPMPEPVLAQPGPSRALPHWVTDQQRSSPAPNGTGTIPETKSDLPPAVPEVKKMIFKPRIPGKKDKGKQREEMPPAQVTLPRPVNTSVKTEPALEPEPEPEPVVDNVVSPVIAGIYGQAQSQLGNGDISMEDIKPDIRALEMMDVDVRDADWVQKEGVLAVNKRDLHPSCFSKDAAKRKRARDKLKENKMRVLEKQGRAITYTHWRDDGVAFDWKLVSITGDFNAGKEEGNGDGDAVESVEVEVPQTAQQINVISTEETPPRREGSEQASLLAPQDNSQLPSSPTTSSSQSSIDQPLAEQSRTGSTAVPSAELTTDANVSSTSDPFLSKPATSQSSSTVPAHQPFSPATVAPSPDRDDANPGPLISDPVSRPSTCADLRIPDNAINPRYHGHGVTFLVAYPPRFGSAKRRAASNAAIEEWMEEQRRSADQMNDEKKYATRVFYVDRSDSVGMTIKTISPSLMDTWPNSHFTHERIIAFPEEWQTPEQREKAKGKVRKWIENYCKEVSEPDQKGRPTRWVRPDRRRSTVIFRWRLKTKEEIESTVLPSTVDNKTSPKKASSVQLVRELIPPPNAENVQHGNKSMTFAISYPPQFENDKKRDPLDFKKWKEQQKHNASMPDERGRPTYIVSYRALEKLYVRVSSYDPEDTSTWSSDGFDSLLEVRYPDQWQDPKFRHTDKKALNVWIQQQIHDVSLCDHLGRSTQWVKATKTDHSLELRWRKKTKEELESGRGRIVDPSEGSRTVEQAQSSNDNAKSSSRPQNNRLDKGKAKAIDPAPSATNEAQNPTTTLAHLGIGNAVPNRNTIGTGSDSVEVHKGKNAKEKNENIIPRQVYSHEEVLAFPSRWEDRREQERDKVALDRWIQGQARTVSMPDANGRPTRWIKVIKRDTDVLIRWKAKADEVRTNSATPAPVPVPVLSAAVSIPSKKSNKRARELEMGADAEAEQMNAPTSTSMTTFSQDTDDIKPPEVKRRKSSVPPAATDGDGDGASAPARSTPQSRPTHTSTSISNLNLTTPHVTTTSINGNSIQDRRPSQSQSVSSHIEAQSQPQHRSQTNIPELVSAELDALNASLRAKVDQIERWASVVADFPDLRERLEGQIERTQEAIFGLHDAIREEKERLRTALQGRQ